MAYGPATYMQVGGEVYDTWSGGCNQHTSTSMGSGRAPPNLGLWLVSNTIETYMWITGAGAYNEASLDFFVAPSCEDDYNVPGVCGLQSGYWTNGCGSAIRGVQREVFTGAGGSNSGESISLGRGRESMRGWCSPLPAGCRDPRDARRKMGVRACQAVPRRHGPRAMDARGHGAHAARRPAPRFPMRRFLLCKRLRHDDEATSRKAICTWSASTRSLLFYSGQ